MNIPTVLTFGKLYRLRVTPIQHTVIYNQVGFFLIIDQRF